MAAYQLYRGISYYRGHPDPGRFLLKLNSLTRYRCDEIKTNWYAYIEQSGQISMRSKQN